MVHRALTTDMIFLAFSWFVFSSQAWLSRLVVECTAPPITTVDVWDWSSNLAPRFTSSLENISQSSLRYRRQMEKLTETCYFTELLIVRVLTSFKHILSAMVTFEDKLFHLWVFELASCILSSKLPIETTGNLSSIDSGTLTFNLDILLHRHQDIKWIKVASNTTAGYVIMYIQNDIMMFKNVI